VKIRIKEIWLRKGEGEIPLPNPVTVRTMSEANAVLLRWARRIDKMMLGYDKTDFKIIFEDGSEYGGRLDMKHPTNYNSDHQLDTHCINMLKVYAGRCRPSWMTEDKYKAFLETLQEDASAWLDNYDFEGRHSGGNMTVEKASEIVLELARENALDPNDHKHEEGLRREAERQREAIAVIEDFFVNVVSEDRQL